MTTIIKYSMLIGCLATLLLSCENSNKKIEPSVKWGYDNLEVKKEFFFLDGEKEYIFEFIPSEDSDLYQARIYLPDVTFERTDVTNNEFTIPIRNSLEGFTFRILRKSDGQILTERSIIDTRESRRTNSFNSEKPLSIHLGSKLSMSANETYEVVIQVPATKDTMAVKSFEIGIGQGRQVAL
ncbi:MAG: hypothetical protein F6K19_37075 [Cyanothece sp. SIO1E1]|nr:hypothetical protein [Cyanothece sp. SIO1E1]